MMPYMEKDQDALRGMAVSAVEKLGRMTDAEFEALCAELEPAF